MWSIKQSRRSSTCIQPNLCIETWRSGQWWQWITVREWRSRQMRNDELDPLWCAASACVCVFCPLSILFSRVTCCWTVSVMWRCAISVSRAPCWGQAIHKVRKKKREVRRGSWREKERENQREEERTEVEQEERIRRWWDWIREVRRQREISERGTGKRIGADFGFFSFFFFFSFCCLLFFVFYSFLICVTIMAHFPLLKFLSSRSVLVCLMFGRSCCSHRLCCNTVWSRKW